jgi:hypothetical protein
MNRGQDEGKEHQKFRLRQNQAKTRQRERQENPIERGEIADCRAARPGHDCLAMGMGVTGGR